MRLLKSNTGFIFERNSVWKTAELKRILFHDKNVQFIDSTPSNTKFVIYLETKSRTKKANETKVRGGNECNEENVCQFYLFDSENSLCKYHGTCYSFFQSQNYVDMRFGLCSRSAKFVHLKFDVSIDPFIKVFDFLSETEREIRFSEGDVEVIHNECDPVSKACGSVVSVIDFLFLHSSDLLFCCGPIIFYLSMKKFQVSKRIMHRISADVSYVSLKYFPPGRKQDEFFLYNVIPVLSNVEVGIIYRIHYRPGEEEENGSNGPNESAITFTKEKEVDLRLIKFIGPLNHSRSRIVTLHRNTNYKTLEFREFPSLRLIRYFSPFTNHSVQRISSYEFIRGRKLRNDSSIVLVNYQESIASYWWKSSVKTMLLHTEKEMVCSNNGINGFQKKKNVRDEQLRKKAGARFLFQEFEVNGERITFDIYRKDVVDILPVDCMLYIFAFLDFRDMLRRVEPICRTFYNSNFLWKLMYGYHYTITSLVAEDSDEKEVNYKTVYLKRKLKEESYKFVKKRWRRCNIRDQRFESDDVVCDGFGGILIDVLEKNYHV